MPKEMVTIAHPGILRRARVARTALKSLSPEWRVVGDGDAPVKPRRRARKSTSAPADVPEQVSESTTGPVSGAEEE